MNEVVQGVDKNNHGLFLESETLLNASCGTKLCFVLVHNCIRLRSGVVIPSLAKIKPTL